MATALLSFPTSRLPHFGVYLSNFGNSDTIRTVFRAGLDHRRALIKVRVDAAIHHILRNLYRLSPDIAEFENTSKPRFHSPDFTYTLSFDGTYRPYIVVTAYDKVEYDGYFFAWLGRAPNVSRQAGYTPRDRLRKRRTRATKLLSAPAEIRSAPQKPPIVEEISWEEFTAKKQAERAAGIYTAPRMKRRITVDFSGIGSHHKEPEDSSLLDPGSPWGKDE